MRTILSSLFLFFCLCIANAENIKIDLSGQWMFRLDSLNRGVQESWQNIAFNEFITLPGSIQNQGYGNDVTKNTSWLTNQSRSSSWFIHPMYKEFREGEKVYYPNNFQPDKHYVGAAWYKKEIYVPKDFKEREVLLSFERVHWQSMLWIDDILVDSCNSLLAPHIYDISKFVQPGKKQIITLRIDNSEIIDVGINAHSWGDQTMTAWNGIVGEMSLIANEFVYMEDIQIYPDVKAKNAKLNIKLKNLTNEPIQTTLSWVINSYNTDIKQQILPSSATVVVEPGIQEFSHTIDLGDNALLWSEYHPNLYKLQTVLQSESIHQLYQHSFGIRELAVKDNRFYLNGKEIYLRGNVLCGTFPLTGYASMEYSDWKRIMTIHKYYGLNHVRFHSWTPPKVAFQAADEVGIYLLAETDVWTSVRTTQQESFLQQEGDLALKYYGNHPSFVFMGIGNELSAKKEITNSLLGKWKKDTRRLYTGLANSTGSITSLYDFIITREVRSNIGWPPRPEVSYFYRNKPSTDFVFDNPVKYPVPLITHEAGQHCSYPALDQMMKFTGSQFAGYIETARKQLQDRGMLYQWPDFVKASGKLQTLLYKHELETYLRMPRHTGYQILQIEDFPGQGGALVGILDYFYDSKGYVTAQEFREFCHEQVLLAKFPKFVWSTSECFKAEVLYSNWSEHILRNKSVHSQIVNEKGEILYRKMMTPDSISRGDAVSLGYLQMDLHDIDEPCKLILQANVVDSDIQNEWSFWVYPTEQSFPEDKEITIVTDWDDKVEKEVSEGKTVILQLDKKQIRGNLPPSFLPVYWTQFDKMGNSQTLGILCNPKHPLFKYFPTESHTNWQWFDLLNNAHPLIFDEFGMSNSWNKDFTPLIQLIDGWKTNRKLGVLAEGSLGKGRLVITSMNLTDSLETRLSVRQFRFSLFAYMNSKEFNPFNQITSDQIRALLNKQSEGKLFDNINSIYFENINTKDTYANLIDGNKGTKWTGEYINEKKPASIVVELKKPEGVGGLIYTSSITGKQKNIPYRLYLSQDGKEWGIPLVEGVFSHKAVSQEIDLLYFHQAKYIKIELPAMSGMNQLDITELELMVE
ncbi:MAG: sugar-binding domain-containing protein [Parabacteroides gordonii]|uniref:sugar-binding domain-containing protein n=1 Tax=Parabacteroides gordonii TaxID=574930 RepID=UPI003A85BC8A